MSEDSGASAASVQQSDAPRRLSVVVEPRVPNGEIDIYNDDGYIDAKSISSYLSEYDIDYSKHRPKLSEKQREVCNKVIAFIEKDLEKIDEKLSKPKDALIRLTTEAQSRYDMIGELEISIIHRLRETNDSIHNTEINIHRIMEELNEINESIQRHYSECKIFAREYYKESQCLNYMREFIK
jgi:chromosome segregation ATPase